MRGVILAGGRGTRMGLSTRVVNKHALPVFDTPMIRYPLKTLRAMGCDDVLVITSPEGVGDLAELAPECTFRVQPEPDGVAGALLLAEGYASGLFPVILGDNYFGQAPPMPDGPTLYTYEHPEPGRFGVLHDGRIVEKPADPQSKTVVTGLYVYDDRVFATARGLAKSGRGEFEITDVNNWYLDQGASVVGVGGTWSDMGTPQTLLEIAQLAAT